MVISSYFCVAVVNAPQSVTLLMSAALLDRERHVAADRAVSSHA